MITESISQRQELKIRNFIKAVLAAALGVSSFGALAATEGVKSSTLYDAKHLPIGEVILTPAADGVILRVSGKTLPPGWHGIHFHEVGDCSDAGFKAAGSHVHASKPVVHGFLVEGANDAGDLPNLNVTRNGTAMAEFHSTLVSLDGANGKPALLDTDGSALVIHANPDDYRTQPIGGAGGRIACAVIK